MNDKQTARRGESLIAPGVDRLINKGEVAEILRVSTRTVDRLVSAGKITLRKVSKRRVCFQLGEILKHAGIASVPSPSKS
jgi:excisionase family DNA binding protein